MRLATTVPSLGLPVLGLPVLGIVVLGLVALGLGACGADNQAPVASETTVGPDATTPPPAATDPKPAPKPAPTPPADWPSAAARRLEADHAPTPFTLDQIRQGCPSGLRATFRMTSGGKERIEVFGFDNANEAGVDFTLSPQEADGTPIGAPRTNRVEWSSLQRHADFPAKYTAIEDTVLTVPAGTYACMKYTVTQSDEGKTRVGIYWFAYELPGAPIKWVQSADGVVLAKRILLKRKIVK